MYDLKMMKPMKLMKMMNYEVNTMQMGAFTQSSDISFRSGYYIYR